MSILTLLLFVLLVLAFMYGKQIAQSNDANKAKLRHQLNYLKAIGTLALVIGIFGQLLGLYNAFAAIEAVGAVSPKILVGGLKVSMASTMYGLLIYGIGYLLWLGLNWRLK